MSRLSQSTLKFFGISSQFHELPLRYRTAVSQAPLVVVVALICAVAAWQLPEVFHRREFVAGLVTLAVATAVCIALPWNRLWYPSYWIIPLLDFVAIAQLQHGSTGILNGLSLLHVFPVFWMSWSRVSPPAARYLSFFCPLLSVWHPFILGTSGPVSGADLSAPLLVPLVSLGVAITVSVLREDIRSQRETLENKDRLLEAALAESKRQSQQLDGVLNAINVGVLLVDEDGVPRHMNRRQRMLQERALPPGTVHPHERDLFLYTVDRTTPVPFDQRPVARALRGSDFSDLQLWLGPPGSQMAMNVSGAVLRNDDGGFNGAVIVFSDVTAMVGALAAKDDFVASVSHELRTPLTSIMGYLDLALDEAEETGLQGTIPGSMRVALRNSERLLRLVSDLLTAASGTVQLESRPMCLAEIIRNSLRTAETRAREAGVDLVNDAPAELPMFADPHRIAQVLDNLLSNAVKYSPDGGTVTVSAWREGDRAVFRVSDTGMGMTADDVDDVFEKFFRTGTVRQAGIPGVGLGMAISKDIAEAHGGSIRVESTLGRGTSFTVELPAGVPALA
ncbi:cell wall metabolism sensor histidine kinase WalK [Arthrobacter sp. zg-Y1171]|uniref:sensor histidine kinase n=1 Tax=unclassified Arthrobacter TaxID=235627 RepID=UPI0021051115|nr:ATP-binding protein [Arthrobacter sp. zg-Y1171]MCQ1947859.1 cell wall metabolism sensor histidine kinase WalK [Arthrobacter sp. zg-Y1116]MCQ1996237.1 cell wall metabolism sensor histidine kinase WalK [Arthrobacter sp. zg-Y1171]UWX82709.1 cell wall metabolism sensor histidine kinase WalK [Arthrobacter sp. zg-Y1171]